MQTESTDQIATSDGFESIPLLELSSIDLSPTLTPADAKNENDTIPDQDVVDHKDNEASQ